jgi:hypothetical protein
MKASNLSVGRWRLVAWSFPEGWTVIIVLLTATQKLVTTLCCNPSGVMYLTLQFCVFRFCSSRLPHANCVFRLCSGSGGVSVEVLVVASNAARWWSRLATCFGYFLGSYRAATQWCYVCPRLLLYGELLGSSLSSLPLKPMTYGLFLKVQLNVNQTYPCSIWTVLDWCIWWWDIFCSWFEICLAVEVWGFGWEEHLVGVAYDYTIHFYPVFLKVLTKCTGCMMNS